MSALEKPPEGDPPGKANFDVVIWNWAGDVDPNSLLKNVTIELDQERNSDSFFSNPRYDELIDAPGQSEKDATKRKAYIDEMQQLAYDQAPYHVLFYDAACTRTGPTGSGAGTSSRRSVACRSSATATPTTAC